MQCSLGDIGCALLIAKSLYVKHAFWLTRQTCHHRILGPCAACGWSQNALQIERDAETLQAQHNMPASIRSGKMYRQYGKMYRQCSKMACKPVYRNKQSIFNRLHAICSIQADTVQYSSILRYLLSSTFQQFAGSTARLQSVKTDKTICVYISMQTCRQRQHVVAVHTQAIRYQVV